MSEMNSGVLHGVTTRDPADPTLIDWAARQAAAAISYEMVAGLPVNPVEQTGRPGQGDLWFWGECQAADAIVLATLNEVRHILLIQRSDGHGWAAPGGCLDAGEDGLTAAVRELKEETGLILPGAEWTVRPVRYVPDPRASDHAWMVTWPCVADLGGVDQLPAVQGGDDAQRAAWVPAPSYEALTAALDQLGGTTVFPAHVDMLREVLG